MCTRFQRALDLVVDACAQSRPVLNNFAKGCGSTYLSAFPQLRKYLITRLLSALFIYYTLFNTALQDQIYYSQTAFAVLALSK